VEPNTKLFPAVFVRPTSANLFQFELTKIKVRAPDRQSLRPLFTAATVFCKKKETLFFYGPHLLIEIINVLPWMDE
jgi:hypothetical protein